MDTSFLQGLATLETRDGVKSIKGPNGEDSNNLFNIKDNSGQGFKAFDKAEGSHDAYRTYPTREASIQDLVSLLARKYPDAHAALTQGGTPEQFASALAQGGYATDPNYASKLASTINSVQTKQASTDLDALRSQGWGGDIDAATQNGWKPADTVARIKGVIGSAIPQVIQMTAQGQAPAAIVQTLSKSQVAPMISAMTSAGATPNDIVAQIGGKELAAFNSKQAATGVGSNLYAGASDAAGDLKAGAQQIGARISGDDDRLHQLQQEQIAREADPERIARGNTISGQIGSGAVNALPAVAGTALTVATGGADLIPLAIGGAATGAASGALRPTTADGQFANNVGTEALLGGAAGAAGPLVGKAVNGVSSSLGKALLGGSERGAAASALLDDAARQGLPARLMDVSPTAKSLAKGLGSNGTIAASNEGVDSALAGKISEGLGLPGYTGPIDSEMLKAARPAIQEGLDNATNVSVTLPQSLKADLEPMINGSNNPLTKGIATNSTVKTAVSNLMKAVDDGTPVAGKALQELNSELKALAGNQTASATERQMAAQLVGKINTTLTDAMTPEQAAAYKLANQQYTNLKTVEKMVSASNDTGVVTPRQILQAAKSGRTRNAFLNGDAPFQDLGGAAADLYGPSSNHGLADVLGSALDNHGSGGLGTLLAIAHPHVGIPAMAAKALGKQLLAKALVSENPALIRLVTGGAKSLDSDTAASLASALSAKAVPIAAATAPKVAEVAPITPVAPKAIVAPTVTYTTADAETHPDTIALIKELQKPKAQRSKALKA